MQARKDQIIRISLFSLMLVTVVALISFVVLERVSPAKGSSAATITADPASATPVFECFNVQAVNTTAAPQPGADPKAMVRLYTQNFGGNLTRVRQIIAMCESAVKYTPPVGASDDTPLPDPAATQIFACYNLERANNPNDPYRLTTANFGPDVVIVRASQMMCEEATKTRVDAAGIVTTTGSLDEPIDIWQCFNVAQGKDAAAALRLGTNNFGRQDVHVSNGIQLCESASKTRALATAVVTVGHADGQVYECFRLESRDDPKAQVTLTTRNFGAVDVIVRRAQTMCERADKEPILTLPLSGDDANN